MKVFISYSQFDVEIAKSIVSILNNNKIDFFIDNANINIGEDLLKKVDNELFKEATHLITIISPSSIDSQWVAYEIATAKATNKVILPYLTHPGLKTNIPFYIKNLKYATKLEEISDYFEKISDITQFVNPEEKNRLVFLKQLENVDKIFEKISIGATPELLQKLVDEGLLLVQSVDNKEYKSFYSYEVGEMRKSYYEICLELKRIVEEFNGDIANNHDNIRVYLNNMWRTIKIIRGL